MGAEHRTEERVRAALRVSLGDVTGVTRDVSASGLYFETDGHFSPGRFANLSQQQWHFIETFVRCKAKIKDVEVALDISYPTVVSRLNDVVRALGFDVGDDAAEMRRVAAAEEKRRDTLEKLSKGEISPKDALRAFDSDAAAE